MAIVYDNLGEKQKSLEFYELALAAWREIGNRPGEARALNYMGRAYSDLGQKQKALELYNQALPIWRDVAESQRRSAGSQRYRQSLCGSRSKPEGAGFLQPGIAPLAQSWEPPRRSGDPDESWAEPGRPSETKSKALELDNQSLIAWREVEDRRGQAFALVSIGAVYSDLRQYEKALPMKLAALSLAKTAGDPDHAGRD